MNVMLHRVLRGLLLVLPIMALAQQDGIRVENAWSRAAMQGGTGVVYLAITDNGAPDRLVSIAAPVATKAELHESFTEQGVAKMRGVPALSVSAGAPVMLAPGGYHIMLTGLKQQLKEGDSFPVTLSFEHSGQVTATVTVRRMSGGASKDHDAMDGMTMPGRTQ
jgi:copper(I)-binding protein